MPRTLSRSAALLGAIAIMGLTAGCARTRDHKGYVVDSTLIGTVAPGVDNRESVARTLGRPSFAGQFDKDRTWYYVGRDTKQIGYRTPKPVAQTVLAVHFDDKGNVAAVEQTGMEKIAHVSPFGDKTPTLGSKRGFFRELVVRRAGLDARAAEHRHRGLDADQALGRAEELCHNAEQLPRLARGDLLAVGRRLRLHFSGHVGRKS